MHVSPLTHGFRIYFSVSTSAIITFHYMLRTPYIIPYRLLLPLRPSGALITICNTDKSRFGSFSVYHHLRRITEPISLRLQQVWLIVPRYDRLTAEDCALHIIIWKACRIASYIWRRMDPCTPYAIYDPSPYVYWLLVSIASRGVCPTFPSSSQWLHCAHHWAWCFTVEDLLHPWCGVHGVIIMGSGYLLR